MLCMLHAARRIVAMQNASTTLLKPTCCACVLTHAPRAKRMGMCKARASAGGMWGAHLRAREPRGSGLLEVVFMLASTLPRTSGCSETIESERNPPETGWDGFGCFPAVVRWSQTVTSTCGGPAVGRARGLPKFYNKCCRFYNKLQQSVTTAQGGEGGNHHAGARVFQHVAGVSAPT